MFSKQVRTFLGVAIAIGAGCGESATQELDAALKPSAAFSTPEKVFERCPIKVTNTSTNADSFQWGFGATASPPSATEKEPTVSFATAGDYAISLVANGGGGTASSQQALTVRQATTYSLLDHTYVDAQALSVAVLPSGESVAIEIGELAGPPTTYVKNFITRSTTGGVVGEKPDTFAERLWGTLSSGTVLVSGYDNATSSERLGLMPSTLVEPSTWYPVHPQYKTQIRDVKIVDGIAYIAGLAQVSAGSWQQFVQRRNPQNGEMLSFTLWGTPTGNPRYDGRLAVSATGIFATTGVQRPSSFDVDVTLARFDRQSGDFVAAIATYVRPMLGVSSFQNASMAFIKDKVLISDGVGTYAVTASGQQFPFPNQLPQSRFLEASDGTLVAVGTDDNGKIIILRRYDGELNTLAEGRTPAAAPEVRIYDATAIAEGRDCSIVGVGRQNLGTSVVDFAPAYVRFSANGKL